EQYHRDGYLIPDFRMPAEVLESIKTRHAALVARKPEFRDYCSALLDQDPGFFDYCNKPEILDMVAQLIGEDIALWNSSFFAKPALNGKRTPWHQDGEYWPIRPLATCTVWLAVDDSTVENGCLRVLRGSHRDQRLKKHNTVTAGDVTLTQELDQSEYDESKAVDLVLKAGQISLHDVYLLHGSEANTSPKPRRGMTMRFMPTTSLFDRELALRKSQELKITNHSIRPVYLVRGIDRHGRNQFVNA
ncbi:MAG: phytanoyl-CoA dioxygenase family protein, partial [Quisquiliibacterium sp.]